MKTLDRKAAVAAYKERKTRIGAFAVRAADGQVWVGESTHVDTQKNGLWAGLRMGGSPFRTLQAAWKAQGANAFTYEVLEALPDDTSDLMRKSALKALADGWRERLGAQKL
jgi:hypothetical protein